MARLTREEKLGNLPIQLSNGKRLSLGALRGTSRVVLVAGSKAQVRMPSSKCMVLFNVPSVSVWNFPNHYDLKLPTHLSDESSRVPSCPPRLKICRMPLFKIKAAFDAAEPFKEQLVKHGVFVVPIAIFGV